MTTDDFADGTILEIRKVYPGSEHPYTYVVAKIKGSWYVTGDKTTYTWDAFCSWLGRGTVISTSTAIDFIDVHLPTAKKAAA